MKTTTRSIYATACLIFAATLLSSAPANAADYEGAPGAQYIQENGLELHSDGFYYAPGDTDPTIDGLVQTEEAVPGDGMVTPMTAPVACNGRLDYYRLVSTSNAWTCFRNKGIYSKAVGNYNNIKGQCPGANTARMHYYHSGLKKWAWTNKVFGKSDHTYCWWFPKNQSFAVVTVQIY